MVGGYFAELVSWFARPDGEIAEEGSLRFAVHCFQTGEEFQEVARPSSSVCSWGW
jgi:hypothetical protein